MNEKNWLRENGDKLLALAVFVLALVAVMISAHCGAKDTQAWAERLTDQAFAAVTTLLTAGIVAAKVARSADKDQK